MVVWLIERDGGESWSLREKVKLRHGKFDKSPIRCSIPISISLVDIILTSQDTSSFLLNRLVQRISCCTIIDNDGLVDRKGWNRKKVKLRHERPTIL
jgi:hypothetical protein